MAMVVWVVSVENLPFKIGRESVEPGAVFVLQIDERGYRRRPPSWPWRDAPQHRRRRGLAVLAPLGAVPRLALGHGHRGNTDPGCGHPPPPIDNRDVTFPRGL
jgi:hypothetical protein